jgi:ribose 5-phosphate isomerase A
MPQKHSTTIATHALIMVENNSRIGLGTGRAATEFVKALGQRVREGLQIQAVPTSQATAQLATELGIPLLPLAEALPLDITVDGADEVDPRLNLIKGLGGALVREKIVAAASKRLIILVGREKLVKALGEHGVLPVEVVPFGLALGRRRLHDLGFPSVPRQKDGELFITDNGNNILDCTISPLENPAECDVLIRSVPGVVGTGLFVGMADLVLVQDGDGVDILQKPPTPGNKGAR